MKVDILETGFEPFTEVSHYQAAMQAAGKFGAAAVFVGSMRDFNDGDLVAQMWLEHYPGMTEKYLEKISREAIERWDLLDSLILHRVGQIHPAEAIVLVAVWSAHRVAAFEASRWLMEELKSRAPFWKKETLSEGERWVAKNTPG